MLLAWLLACQTPFGTDRHDLVGFRVAAIEVGPAGPGDDVTPRLAVIVDSRPFADDQPLLDWFWLTDPQELQHVDALDLPDGLGPAPTLTVPSDRAVLGLLARQGSEEQRAFVVLDPLAGVGDDPVRIAATTVELSLDDWTEETVQASERAALPTGSETDQVDVSGFLRLRAEGVETTGRVRWMATAGTFFELDGATSDWVAADVVLDDGAIESSVPSPEGPVTVIALSTGQDAARFRATDLWVGEADAFTRTQGRVLPGLALDGPATVRLVADDMAPSGLSIADPEPALPTDEPGTASLPCFAPVDGPFDPNWLLELRCAREALVGRRVLVVPD